MATTIPAIIPPVIKVFTGLAAMLVLLMVVGIVDDVNFVAKYAGQYTIATVLVILPAMHVQEARVRFVHCRGFPPINLHEKNVDEQGYFFSFIKP